MKQIPEIFVNMIRWIIYTIISALIIIPFNASIGKHIALSLLLGWFMSVGNEIITQLKAFNQFLNNKNDNNGKDPESGSR